MKIFTFVFLLSSSSVLCSVVNSIFNHLKSGHINVFQAKSDDDRAVADLLRHFKLYNNNSDLLVTFQDLKSDLHLAILSNVLYTVITAIYRVFSDENLS